MVSLFHGDCLIEQKTVPTHSIDLITTDLPYGITQNKWDSVIPVAPLWEMFNRVLKPSGVIVLCAVLPLAVLLLSHSDAKKMFKYDLVWEKTISSGQLNVNRMPLRSHEYLLIFAHGNHTYNETLSAGRPYTITRKATYKNENYGEQKEHTQVNTGTRRARSVITIPNPRIKNGHPTQKPVALMEYIIKTYSKIGDTVFDCCMGSGTTGVACVNLNRNFIGIEKDEKYFKSAHTRLQTIS